MQLINFTATIPISPSPSVESSISLPESSSRSMYGFRFWLTAQRSTSGTGDLLEIRLDSEPESFSADSYQLIADYRLTLLNEHDVQCAGISVNFELVKKGYSERSEEERWTLRIGWDEAVAGKCIKANPATDQSPESYSCTVRCHLKIRDLLTDHKENYNEESPPRRDFELLLQNQTQFYVDLQYLADQGSEYFQDLLESKRKGVRRAVILNVEPSDVEIFLHAVCTHRKPVITNRNFDVVLSVAQEFCVDKMLRACEAYLIESDSIHPVRKLEYAAEFGLGLLGETVTRQLNDTRPMAALEALHEYLQMNNEKIDQMHPDVLYSLNIFDRYVVL